MSGVNATSYSYFGFSADHPFVFPSRELFRFGAGRAAPLHLLSSRGCARNYRPVPSGNLAFFATARRAAIFFSPTCCSFFSPAFCPRNCALTVFCRYFPLSCFFFPLPPFLFRRPPSRSPRARTLPLSYRRPRGWCPLSSEFLAERSRCNALSTAPDPRERGMRNVARFASELAGSLHAAVTTSITFQRSLSVRLCERPCASSRPTCIARHNFTGRTRCLHAGAKIRNLSCFSLLSSLPSDAILRRRASTEALSRRGGSSISLRPRNNVPKSNGETLGFSNS